MHISGNFRAIVTSVKYCIPRCASLAHMTSPHQQVSREAMRPDALRQLELLDTAPSEAFDRITRMASQLFQLPIAAVSLTDVDRQWFRSRVGGEHNAGYSSLAYLQDMPADVVKIDQSFVRGMENDERTLALVTTMIKLSHDLGHRVVAEGVETAEVAQLLRVAGCDEAQGYYYARPMVPALLGEWLAERSA